MNKVYLDNAAANPVLPEVREAMLPFISDIFGNPSSIHDWGDPAREAVEEARQKVAALIGASMPDELIFTASGTESNNLAIKGLAMARRNKGRHIVISSIEHLSVINSIKFLEKLGFECTAVPVDKYGRVNPEDVENNLRPDTVLVSIMHANNEVGTIQPLQDISKITRERKIAFHTDAVATCGTVPLDVQNLGVDALSLSGNAFYGPQGSAALWLKKGVNIVPLLDGGIQEGGRRAGTENVAAIVGMGKAAELAAGSISSRLPKLTAIRDKLIRELPARIHHVILTGHPEKRLPGLASFCVEFIEGESMLMLLNSRGIAVSSSSSCTSRALKASHVLIAMGLNHEIAQGSLLLSAGINNEMKDVDYVLEQMPPVVAKLRQMSPLYAKYLKTVSGGHHNASIQ